MPFDWLCPSILPGAESDRDRYRLDRHAGEQFVEKALPALATFGCFGASDTMREFQHGDNGNSDSFIAGFEHYSFQELARVLTLSFGGNGGRGIEHQSQAGGSSGSR